PAPAALGSVDKKANTELVLPSYTSGTQKCSGNMESLKPKPARVAKTARPTANVSASASLAAKSPFNCRDPVSPYKSEIPYSITAEQTAPKSTYFMALSAGSRSRVV